MEELYKKYSKFIYIYLYSLCKDTFLAEELVQETFYSAIKNSTKYKSDSDNVKSWLYKIAKNKWIDYTRKQKIENTIEFNEYLDTTINEDTIESTVIKREEILDFYKRIHSLDENTREVIYLRIKGELSFKEIATILNKSEEWARVTFYRGKFKLKEDLNDGTK